jgi:hypothetical protein
MTATYYWNQRNMNKHKFTELLAYVLQITAQHHSARWQEMRIFVVNGLHISISFLFLFEPTNHSTIDLGTCHTYVSS